MLRAHARSYNNTVKRHVMLYCMHVYMRIYNTVKPVYNDHSRGQVIVVSVDRWSLYRGALVQLKCMDIEPAYSGLYRQVVFICEWSLRQVLL